MSETPKGTAPVFAEVNVEKVQQALIGDERVSHFADVVPRPQDQRSKEEFYLFTSFDLANSTAFKTKFPQDWPFLTRTFFDVVEQKMREHFAELDHVSIKLWKYAGDEVLFYQKITSIQDCYHAAPIARRVLDAAIKEIQSDEKARELLSVKATIWCARTVHFRRGTVRGELGLAEKEGDCRNLVIRDAYNNLDFLGPEVDTGFRIAKFATRDRLLVSADLAYLYWKNEGKLGTIQDFYQLAHKPSALMKIVGYERLKGVWDERGYPIIWFEENWDDFRHPLRYDDHLEAPLLTNIKLKNTSALNELDNVYLNRGQKERIEKFLQDIQVHTDTNEDTIELRNRRQAEIHCVPVCVNDEGKVLAALRPDDKAIAPSCWEFGCGQLENDESIEECLTRTCLEDFGLNMNPNQRPIALGHFEFEKEELGAKRKIPGVIFAVHCLSDKTAQKHKHVEIRWIDATNFPFKADECVSDFEDMTNLAVTRAKEEWKIPSI